MTRIILAGNPNCGKTTLFNALTGDNQRVGNWPGVTVEQKTGTLCLSDQDAELIDLPGIYTLSMQSDASIDTQIAAQAVRKQHYDIIINVVDACFLERHLYLSTQLLELKKPMVIVLTMMDLARLRGITIDMASLAARLGCCVVAVEALKKQGLEALWEVLNHPLHTTQPLALSLPKDCLQRIESLTRTLVAVYPDSRYAYYDAMRYMEGDITVSAALPPPVDGDDLLVADARYCAIHTIMASVETRSAHASEHITAQIDKIVLHRFLGIPLFLGMMYAMFFFAINIGGAFQDFFDISTDAIFVQGSAWLLAQCSAPDWLVAVIAQGLGRGINTTLTFIPVIASMFFFLSLLETTGYMARAAFVVDKLMRILGLPGKAFVPMIVGFGCNVPAIMAARILDTEQDRLLTVLISPFMSCSARLAIYTIFVAAFFKTGGANIIFLLYCTGILMAVLTACMLRRTTLRQHSAALILELPVYHRPSLRRLLHETSRRLRLFLLRAGRIIIPVCMLMGFLNVMTLQGVVHMGDAGADTILSQIARWITPVFAPMGIDEANWPATVGLMTGMLAKEVVVGTLNTLYAQIGHIAMLAPSLDIGARLQEAVYSIPQNLALLGSALRDPVLASAPDNTLLPSVYGVMAARFDGKTGAFAYMLFILLYIPCVSTMGVIRQESNRRWMLFSIAWSFFAAYAVSTAFYQCATCIRHPVQSVVWMMCLTVCTMLIIKLMRWAGLRREGSYALANP